MYFSAEKHNFSALVSLKSLKIALFKSTINFNILVWISQRPPQLPSQTWCAPGKFGPQQGDPTNCERLGHPTASVPRNSKRQAGRLKQNDWCASSPAGCGASSQHESVSSAWEWILYDFEVQDQVSPRIRLTLSCRTHKSVRLLALPGSGGGLLKCQPIVWISNIDGYVCFFLCQEFVFAICVMSIGERTHSQWGMQRKIVFYFTWRKINHIFIDGVCKLDAQDRGKIGRFSSTEKGLLCL